MNKEESLKVNRFVIMCVEQYALHTNNSSKGAYALLFENGIIKELTDDYEDLHGMSNIWINDYIDGLLKK